jgi:hypothetical protein
VGGNHAVVVIGSGYERCRIFGSGLEVMQRRIATQVLEHLRAVL